tara:strand:+ start:755 stop:1021 length:267 start_codon:yes stop_codon:yes gene_type:complete
MNWEDILKESRLEKLRSVITKYVDARYAGLATEGLDESTVNEFIESEIEEIRAMLYANTKNGNTFSDGTDARPYIESTKNYITELQQI